MGRKPTAREIRDRVRRLGPADKGKVPLEKVLITLANHEAVIRMLAQSYPSTDEVDLRRSLAELSTLLRELRMWAASSRSAVATDKRGEGKAAPSPGAGVAEPARKPGTDGTTSDPGRLAAYDKVKVFIDGAAKGNPGPAAVAIVITDLDGTAIFEDARCIGRATNNQAEYTALIEALKILLAEGRRPEAYCFSDSELMVKQMNGLYKVKNQRLKPLVIEAQALRRRLRRFELTHVPREKNKRADRLASLALKQAQDASAM